ncbi:unnamed protein product [Heligmosomoides polygyrus]|uniref:AAA_12 domain-containing protein n=1 Tax=Heligmosomoides polygyrus TaxID=6339 RepID=A0A183GF27_HELPZ|nr:unnamed protein product [Heligmosomoides polygyrus]
MGQRTPVVAVLSDQAPSLLMAPFSGSGDQGMHFSFWLRQLEDLLHIRSVPPTDEQKAYFLIAHLSGTAGEKVEELPREKRLNYAALTEFLRTYFEGPQQRLVEQVLTKAAADRLLHPAQPIVEVHALDHGHSPRRPEFDQAYQPRMPEFDHAYQRPEQSYGPRQDARIMPCVPTAPPAKQVRFDDATERLQELSLAVDRTKSELEQSKAQIAALRQRNEELASSAFKSTISAPTSRPDVKALILCSMAVCLFLGASAEADAWLCPSENPSQLFFVPSAYNCLTRSSIRHRAHSAGSFGNRSTSRSTIRPESIAVITFYKEQCRCMESYAQNQGIDLYTVDSVQGREKDIVILLATRSHFEADRAEFLDDPRRMNVAITRSKHGLIILGHERSLTRLPTWGRLIRWARARDAIIRPPELVDCFP